MSPNFPAMPASHIGWSHSGSTVTVLPSTAVFLSRYLPWRIIGCTAQH